MINLPFLANFMVMPGSGTCLIGKVELSLIQCALFIAGVLTAVFLHSLGIVAAFMAWTWSIDTVKDHFR